jgi:outer membrane immunogenic protein
MKIKLALFSVALCIGTVSHAQYNDSHLNAGLGVNSLGVPLYLSYDFPIVEDINLSIWTSFQATTDRYFYNGYDYKLKQTIFGFGVLSQYYIDRVVNLPEQFDVYGGLGLGFYVWQTNTDPLFDSYRDSGGGGVGIIGTVGGRYYISSKVALNLEIAATSRNRLSGGHFGVSFKL